MSDLTAPQHPPYVLQLYVAGSTPQSSRAITNLKAICEAHLKGRYELTVIDLYLHRSWPRTIRSSSRRCSSAFHPRRCAG